MTRIDQGHQDWQNTSPHDSVALMADNGTVYPGQQFFGPFNMAGFEGLSGKLEAQSVTWIFYGFQFYAEQALINLMGERYFVVHNTTVQTAPSLSMRALGPWLRLVATPHPLGSGFTSLITLAAVNRTTDQLVTPPTGVMLNLAGKALGAGVTDTNATVEYAVGAAVLTFFSNIAGAVLVCETETDAGVWTRFYQTVVAANAGQSIQLVLPPAPVRVKVGNPTAGAGTYDLSLVASLTGSS